MINWVDEKCRIWGAHKRWITYGEGDGWEGKSVLGRLIEEGPGAGHESYGARVPIKDPPPAYQAISVALQLMAATHEMGDAVRIVHEHYVERGIAKQKAPRLGVSLKQYWNLLQSAHAFIAGCHVRDDEACTQNTRCA